MIDERMNRGSMEAMAKAFHQAHQQLEGTLSAMNNVAQNMEGGALVGDGGQTFANAINQQLKRRLENLRDKMREMEGDIHKAIQASVEAEKKAQSRFQ